MFQAGEARGAARRGRKYPADPVARDDVERMLRVMSRHAPTAIRNRVIVLLMFRCGLRITEVLTLRPEDVDLKQGRAAVTGKGDKTRWVGLPDDVLLWIEKWLVVRPRGADSLVCTLMGGPVSGQYVRAMLQRIARRAGVDRRVNPHAFRHGFAMELLREDASMPAIQKSLGHASLAATGIYLQHLDTQEVIDVMRSRPALDA